MDSAGFQLSASAVGGESKNAAASMLKPVLNWTNVCSSMIENVG